VGERGRIDRSRTLTLTFDGEPVAAHPGDTLASALLAAGRAAVARSVVHGRPRGIFAAGAEEPNAYVQIEAPWAEPLVAAPLVEAVDGLRASSLAGVGRLGDRDRERHDKRHAHCDVLVVGAGRSGIAAAREAAAAGRRVIVCDEDFAPAGPVDELAGLPDVRVLLRTAALGAYDANLAMLLERVSPTRRRLWQVRAREIVVATGAAERPIVFPGNDRPGVMLAGAARRYLDRFALAPERAVVFCNNDRGRGVAADLAAAGAEVTVVDVRDGHAVVGTEGDGALAAALVAPLDAPARVERVPCDLLAVSGGFDPVLDLHHHRRGAVRWDGARACFVPSVPGAEMRIVGAAAGEGLPPVEPLWAVPGADAEAYVDLQRDVTLADVRRAVDAGLSSIEHVKRYTLIGTGVDQGRTAKVNAAALAASLLGLRPGATGTSTTRPPTRPVSFAALAGRAAGARFEPVRTTPIHAWHVEHGAVFEDVGQWKRPWYFPRAGEDMDAAVLRECAAAREAVALMDASTLGKIDVQGPDAAELLNRLYTNAYDTLRVGRCRYGVMCKVDGMVFDDGVVMRLAEDRFLATTTTGNAAAVLDWMEEWVQTEWPELRVHLTSVTEQLATVAVVGPRARDVLAPLAPALDLSAAAFPFMSFQEGAVVGIDARVARISFSGELAFEVSVPGYRGLELWRALWRAGEPHGITAYGTETMHVLRAEKGYVIVGQETDGTVTPIDLGMDWIVSKTKDFVGRRSLRRGDTGRADREQLVALLPDDPSARLAEGAQLVVDPSPSPPVPMVGHVTSSYRSAALGRTFALAMVERGRERHGETLYAPAAGGAVAARVADPVLYDPEGARRDG
jgi:sarcosine oxidase subunit alpha